MASDLGTAGNEVHAKAAEVLRFWFEEVPPERRFAKDDALDAEIEARFEPLRREVLESGAAAWREDGDVLLAAVILLDQFSRNVHRGTADAFAADPLAQELALLAIDKGWDKDRSEAERQFLYMPFMHAEDDALQSLSLKLFEELGQDEALRFARDHAEVIAKYGRYPSRNAALGRSSTSAEEAYLSQPDAGW